MSKPVVHVVFGNQGSYSDHSVWAVRAFPLCSQAVEFAARCRSDASRMARAYDTIMDAHRAECRKHGATFVSSIKDPAVRKTVEDSWDRASERIKKIAPGVDPAVAAASAGGTDYSVEAVPLGPPQA